jgi:uncharacterized protein YjbI with pentapeptide repeats
MARRKRGKGSGDFSGQSLTGVDFSNHELADSDFSGASLSGCDFSNAELERSTFKGASLSGVDFSHADLENSDFTGASLTGCDFSNADLEDSDFQGARVTGCDFDNADTDGCTGLEVVNRSTRGVTIIGGGVRQSGHVVNSVTGWTSGRVQQSGHVVNSVTGWTSGGVGGRANFSGITVGGSLIDLGWLRFESDGSIESPSVSSLGGHHGEIDGRLADFVFTEWLLRAESIGGGKIRLSARNAESDESGEFWEIILGKSESVEVLGGTLYNELE